MFSSFFGKRRSSPIEDEIPPIPGPKVDDDFVVVEPAPLAPGSIYPNVNILPYPQRPAPLPPAHEKFRVDSTFHYLDGVPFSLSRDIEMWTNKDTYGIEIGDLLAYLTTKINLESYYYDFSVEKSVLKEC